MKLGRTWSAEIQAADGTKITVGYPLTIEISVSRNTLASANNGMFRIYNLSAENRKRIFKDRTDTLTYRQIIVTAGYQDEPKLPEIFRGNILAASSSRTRTDWITEIEALDGGFGILNGQVSLTRPSAYNLREVFLSTIKTMPNVVAGAVGDFSADSARGIALMGNSWDIINRMVSKDGDAFIDGEKVNILKHDEYLRDQGDITLITSETGLLSTPKLYNNILEVPILFEPRIVVGQRVQLESIETIYNGIRKVIGVAHNAIISGAVGGEAKTFLTMFKGDLLTSVATE